MLSNSLFRTFEEDPFFSGFHDRAYRGRDPFLALTDGGLGDAQLGYGHHTNSRSRELERHQGRNGSDLVPSGMFNPFGFMNSMMADMDNMMGNMYRQMESMQNDPNGHCFVQSSVMSYRNDGTGQPKIYQATTSTRQAPGGVRETRKAVRDSENGIEKMSVGHHLNDRGHVITRQRNVRNGDIEENQDYINIDEEEAPQFDQEWVQRTSQYSRSQRHNNSVGYQPQSTQSRRALDYQPHAYEGNARQPAVGGQHQSTSRRTQKRPQFEEQI